MKKVLLFLMAVGFIGNAFGWSSSDYYTNKNQAWDYKSYNSQANDLKSDYDGDGIPNYRDPYNNKWYKDPSKLDFDKDGKSNYLDPFNNNK